MTGSVSPGRSVGLTRKPAPLRMMWITAALAGCFLAVRWGLRDAPLLWFAALRALVGGVALAVVAATQRRPIPRSARTWGWVGVLGLVNVSVAFAAMFAGIASLATGVAAVLSNAQPLLILLPAWWLFGERMSARTGIALAIGFGGLLVVAVPGGGGSGALLSLLSAVAVTAGTLMVRVLRDVDIVVVSAAHFLVGGVGLASAALVVEGVPDIAWTARFVGVLAFLGLVTTAATTLAWFVEAQRCPLSSLTPWLLLVPVFGLLIGFVAGERPNSWTVMGVVLVLVSVWASLFKSGAAGAGPPGTLCAEYPPNASTPGPASPAARPSRNFAGPQRIDAPSSKSARRSHRNCKNQ